jgi:extracellular elastinolytic metalloproteinase
MAHDLDVRAFGAAQATAERIAALNRLADQVVSTAGLLGTPVPPFAVDQIDSRTNNPSAITFAHARGGGTAGLAASSDGDLVARAGEIVASIAPVLGVGRARGTDFAAAVGVTDVAGAARIVRLAQRHQGIPVFHAVNALRFAASGDPAALLGSTVTIDDELDPLPDIGAAEAVLAVARFVTAPEAEHGVDQFGVPVSPVQVDLDGFEPRQLARSEDAEQHTVFDAGPFAGPIRASLLWFPVTTGDIRLAWQVTLALPGGFARYRAMVDAHGGAMLYVRQLVQSIRAQATVFPAAVFPFDSTPARQSVELPEPPGSYGLPLPPDLPPDFPGDWVDADRTMGNTANGRFADSDQTLAGTSADGQLRFEPAPETTDEQNVLNAFYLACRMHDYFYLLGFREKDWNFQVSNGARGGTGGDPVEVQAHPGPIPLTSSMHTEPEGTSPTLKLGRYADTGRHCALDATVVAHEFTHGVTNRLVGGPNDAHALDDPQCRGMGEGWGDYVACTMLSTTVVGAWLVANPAGIRKFAYDASFPADKNHFGKLGTGRYREDHAVGEIWAATLMEMNRAIGSVTLGLQLVVHALKLAAANPSFLAMRDAILAAVGIMVDSGDVPPDAAPAIRDGIWRAFAEFGMGPQAACSGASFDGIVTDTAVPPAETGSTDPFGRVLRTPTTATVATGPADVVELSPATPDAESALTVASAQVVTSLRVTIDIQHPAINHLRVTLRSPAGVRAVLHNQTPAGDRLNRSYTPDDTPALEPMLGHPAAGAWSLVVVDLAGDSEGHLNGWSLEPGLQADQAAAEASPAVAIPDGTPGGVASTVVLAGDGAAGTLQVQLQVTHSKPADLRIELVAPSGKAAVLRDVSDPAGGVVQTFDSGTSATLAGLLGEAIAGVWTLRVADLVAGDTGTLDRWRLSARPAAP